VNDTHLLSIGAFAVSTGLSIAALRHYDEIGLFYPAVIDPDTGYRRYAPDQLDQARLICGLRAVGLPIDDIRAALGQRPSDVLSALGTHRERLVAQVRELSQQVLAIDAAHRRALTAGAAEVPQRTSPGSPAPPLCVAPAATESTSLSRELARA
jgi:DNA-binding transcriptional MerR regulator